MVHRVLPVCAERLRHPPGRDHDRQPVEQTKTALRCDMREMQKKCKRSAKEMQGVAAAGESDNANGPLDQDAS